MSRISKINVNTKPNTITLDSAWPYCQQTKIIERSCHRPIEPALRVFDVARRICGDLPPSSARSSHCESLFARSPQNKAMGGNNWSITLSFELFVNIWTTVPPSSSYTCFNWGLFRFSLLSCLTKLDKIHLWWRHYPRQNGTTLNFLHSSVRFSGQVCWACLYPQSGGFDRLHLSCNPEDKRYYKRNRWTMSLWGLWTNSCQNKWISSYALQ